MEPVLKTKTALHLNTYNACREFRPTSTVSLSLKTMMLWSRPRTECPRGILGDVVLIQDWNNNMGFHSVDY